MVEKDIWADDQLNRKAEGQFLLNYLNELFVDSSEDIYKDSFVLNLNGPWGQGKTYFLDNLEQELKHKKHPVIYFDAWANDYSKTPLLGFLSELQQALKSYSKEIPKGAVLQKSFLENGKKILGTLAGIGTQIVVKQLTGSSLEKIHEDLGIGPETINDATKQLGDTSKNVVEKIVQKSLDEHQKLKGLIQNLKEALQQITQSLHNNAGYSLPMYILVDELDRCRPTYAIELLENIKHIFSTKGVYFIVATNKDQLSHSIQAIYGSNFDSFNYLKRFFNQEYTLSVPETLAFSKFLFEKYRIGQDRFVVPFDAQRNQTDNMALLIFEKLTSSFKLSLRDKEQICVQLKSILLTVKDENIHLIWILTILIFKHFHANSIDTHILAYCEGSYREVKSFRLNAFRNSGNGYAAMELSFFDVVRYYFTIYRETPRKLSEKLNNNTEPWQELILESLLHNTRKGSPVTPLSKYEILVQQAGHLG